jgi:hypothetical protein
MVAGDAVGLEAFGKLPGTAQGHEMATLDLLGPDRQAIARDLPLKPRGEETVIATDEDSRRHVGPAAKAKVGSSVSTIALARRAEKPVR